jgi:hypothetical protein
MIVPVYTAPDQDGAVKVDGFLFGQTKCRTAGGSFGDAVRNLNAAAKLAEFSLIPAHRPAYTCLCVVGSPSSPPASDDDSKASDSEDSESEPLGVDLLLRYVEPGASGCFPTAFNCLRYAGVHSKSRAGDDSLANMRECERASDRPDFLPAVQLPPPSATPLVFRLDIQHLSFLSAASGATPGASRSTKLLARRWLRRFSALCAFPDADLLPRVESYVSAAGIDLGLSPTKSVLLRVDKQMQEFETLLVWRRRLLGALLSRQSLLTVVSDPQVDRWLSSASADNPPAALTRLQNTVTALGKVFHLPPAAAASGQAGCPAGRPASHRDRIAAATTLPRALTLSETHRLFEGLDARPLCADCKRSPLLRRFFLEAFSPKPPISDHVPPTGCPLCHPSAGRKRRRGGRRGGKGNKANASSPVGPAYVASRSADRYSRARQGNNA